MKALLHLTTSCIIICSSIPHTLAQGSMDAGVEFGNDQDKAGDTSVYLFTLRVPDEGDLIRTVLPSSVIYTGSGSSVERCIDVGEFM